MADQKRIEEIRELSLGNGYNDRLVTEGGDVAFLLDALDKALDEVERLKPQIRAALTCASGAIFVDGAEEFEPLIEFSEWDRSADNAARHFDGSEAEGAEVG